MNLRVILILFPAIVPLWSATTKYPFRVFDRNDELSESTVFSMHLDKNGYMWFGTSRGVSRFDGLEFVNFDLGARLGGGIVHRIHEDPDGVIWFAAEGGPVSYRDGQLQNHMGLVKGLSEYAVRDVVGTRDSAIWLATDGAGVVRLKDGGVHRFTTADGLCDNRVRALWEDQRGTIWIGGEGGGLCAFDGGSFYRIAIDSQFIRCLFEDRRGRMWVGSEGGVYSVSGNRAIQYPLPGPPETGGVNAIFEDRAGGLWIGTENAGAFWIRTEDVVHFTVDEGLPSNRILSVAEDDAGSIWFGASAGVSVLPSGDSPAKLPPPHIQLVGFQVNGESRALERFRLAYKENHIRYDFLGVSVSDGKNLVYQYRLEGLDDAWAETTARHVVWSDLPTGSYVFQVRTRNSDGVFSREVVEHSFIIAPPFYERPWFLLLMFGIFAMVFFTRMRILKRRNKGLVRTVEQKKDEIARMNRELEHLSLSDTLTRCRNRRYLELYMMGEMATLRRKVFQLKHASGNFQDAFTIGFAMVALDRLKDTREGHGDEIGDLVVKRVAVRLKSRIRDGDMLTRWGEDAFLILFRHIEVETLGLLADAIRRELFREPFVINQTLTIEMTCSVGFCAFPLNVDPNSYQWTDLLGLVDLAVYRARVQGGNMAIGVETGGAIPIKDLIEAKRNHTVSGLEEYEKAFRVYGE